MKTFKMPGTEITAPNVVLGLMRIQEKTDEEVRELVRTATEAGINFLDHADIYGDGFHGCERRFAEAMKLTPAEREQLVIQTKAGIVKGDSWHFDFSYDHIIKQVNGSLAALETDYIDILLLHRPDALVEPEEVARAFDELAASGKVRAFGVSNHTPRQIDLLRKYVAQPLVANQVQLSVTHAPLIAQGVAANMQGLEQSVSRDEGLLDYCRLNDITVQAWSPFQAGFFDGPFLGSDRYPELNAVIDRIAEKYGVPPIAIAVAWITRHPANIQVVIGTTNLERVAGSAQGSDIPLTRPEWYDILRAAGYTVP
ncbi:aldo/keto reductase [Glycomyces buryatensis]|uniref:Aldo/keto reductase family oxidoreductase n=1 Tax=Glycomyces buryatensis TaxID=2570927 RepID=A0A4S8QCD3_9ACTN|nr:aldo/keto reductase [Glycomyces buryatensis]THV42183.1 aldo/keto reductase family oxidoreductase [Glycomyces buryatensis]